jgi:hypothetical protein
MARVALAIALAACVGGCGSGHGLTPPVTAATTTPSQVVLAGLADGSLCASRRLARHPQSSGVAGYPRARLLLTSYAARRRALQAGPRGGRAAGGRRARVPARYRPRVGDVWSHPPAQFSPRPGRWRVGPARTTECWRVPSHTVLFHRRAARSGPGRIRAARWRRATRRQRVLSSLRFSRLPPLPKDPYAGWHLLTDRAGDSIHAAALGGACGQGPAPVPSRASLPPRTHRRDPGHLAGCPPGWARLLDGRRRLG